MRVVSNDAYPEERDALSRDWPRYLSQIFPEVIVVPLLNQPDAVVPLIKSLKLQGIILSGGNGLGRFPLRDATEKNILTYALAHALPVLGVCRGFQFLNVFFGGKLEKGIHKKSFEDHRSTIHSVTLEDGKNLRVNSFHNQGVMEAGISPHLRIFASTKGGVVEGLYHPKKPIIGVQWHPERKSPSAVFDRKLIKRLFKLP